MAKILKKMLKHVVTHQRSTQGLEYLIPASKSLQPYHNHTSCMIRLRKHIVVRKGNELSILSSMTQITGINGGPFAGRKEIELSHVTPYSADDDTQTAKKDSKDPEKDKEYTTRKANLGTLIQMLQLKVPHLLTETIPHDIVSDDIILRLLPNQFPNFPTIKGYLMCVSTIKTIQKLLHLFYLNPDTQIHINNMKVIEPTNSISSEELINLSIADNVIENEHSNIEGEGVGSSPRQDFSKYTTKIKIKWRTCCPGCSHLQDKETTDAKLGTYRLDHFDWAKLLKSSNPLKTLEGFAKNLDPAGDDASVGRMLTGVFIFELDAKNEHIKVFTIDNMEIIESKEVNFNGGCFAA